MAKTTPSQDGSNSQTGSRSGSHSQCPLQASRDDAAASWNVYGDRIAALEQALQDVRDCHRRDIGSHNSYVHSVIDRVLSV